MERNYIVINNHHQGNDTPLLTFEMLQTASFGFNTAFKLDFSDRSFFYAYQVVRLIPRKRLVAFGLWEGKQVVAKIFFDPLHAKHHLEKDLAGINLLLKNKIPTPKLVHQGYSGDKRIYILLFEHLIHAKNIEEIWHEREMNKEVLAILERVILEIATHHVLGLTQEDLHLKNFLFDEDNEIVYTLDGAEMHTSPVLLPKKPSMHHLALFLSQLGANAKADQEHLFRHYAKARGWLVKPEDVRDLFNLIQYWNQERFRQFAKKIFRNSTQFARIHTFRLNGMYHRRYEGPEFHAFLANPDSLFTHAKAKLLKDGRSATVLQITLDNREFVIKRYNLKNAWHRLRRTFRNTRAHTSWRIAQKFQLFNLPTATPVAFLEYKTLGIRGVSYYVTEFVAGEHAGDYFKRHFYQNDKTVLLIKRMSHLLKNLTHIGIIHGDLKITNILINQDEQPILIDLDGAKENTFLTPLQKEKLWKKELARFLANFAQQPPLRKQFEMEFRQL